MFFQNPNPENRSVHYPPIDVLAYLTSDGCHNNVLKRVFSSFIIITTCTVHQNLLKLKFICFIGKRIWNTFHSQRRERERDRGRGRGRRLDNTHLFDENFRTLQIIIKSYRFISILIILKGISHFVYISLPPSLFLMCLSRFTLY